MTRDDKAIEIAKNGPTCISEAYEWAKSKSQEGFKAPTVLNPSASVTPRINVQARDSYNQQKHALKIMLETPVIARVKYSDEDDNEHEVYISRGPRPDFTDFTIASNNSPYASLASLKPGDGEMLKIKNDVRDVIVTEVVIFRPRHILGGSDWDSIDTRVETEVQSTFTVPSLLGLLRKQTQTEDDPWGMIQMNTIS